MKFDLLGAGRRRRPAALAAVLAGLALGTVTTGVAGAAPAGASTAAAAGTSATTATAATTTVTYQIGTDWGYGFQANLTVTPAVAVAGGWTLEFDAGDQQTLTFAAMAGATQTGRHVTLTNRTFNGSLAAGQTLNLTVQFSNPTYSDVPPASFTFNGQTAAYTPSPYIVVDNAEPTVPEGGSGAFAVRLSQAPASDVVFQVVGPSAPAAITGSPGQLTFTAANWNVPQTVTLASPRDADTTNQTAVFQVNQIRGYPTVFPSDVLLATQLDNG